MKPQDVAPLDRVFAQRQTFSDVRALCPHCGTVTAFHHLSTYGVGDRFRSAETEIVVTAEIAACRACLGIVFGVKLNSSTARLLWPMPRWPDRAPEDLEPEIRKSYDEARAILPLSPMGSAVLARRCLQHIIRMKLSITKKNLFEEIEDAKDRDELTRPTRSALHHIRDIGNWGAHPPSDPATTVIEVTHEEAEYTLQVLELLFHDLYVVPRQVTSMEARIAEKRLP